MIQYTVFRYPVANGHLLPIDQQMAIGIERDGEAYRALFLTLEMYPHPRGQFKLIRMVATFGRLPKKYFRRNVTVRYI